MSKSSRMGKINLYVLTCPLSFLHYNECSQKWKDRHWHLGTLVSEMEDARDLVKMNVELVQQSPGVPLEIFHRIFSTSNDFVLIKTSWKGLGTHLNAVCLTCIPTYAETWRMADWWEYDWWGLTLTFKATCNFSDIMLHNTNYKSLMYFEMHDWTDESFIMHMYTMFNKLHWLSQRPNLNSGAINWQPNRIPLS